jgi:hypothetical protein
MIYAVTFEGWDMFSLDCSEEQGERVRARVERALHIKCGRVTNLEEPCKFHGMPASVDALRECLAYAKQQRAQIEAKHKAEHHAAMNAPASECDKCGGTGIFYWGPCESKHGKPKFSGSCNQCAGTGTMTAQDRYRTSAYWGHRMASHF